MAISVTSLQASLTADVSGFQTGLTNATAALNKFSQAAQTHSAQAESAMGGIGARAVALGGIMANVATSAVGALGNLAQGAVGAVSSFEQMTAKLTALTAKELVDSGQFKNFDEALGTATEKSKTLLDWTQKLAVASPFGEGDVSAVLGVASAFGFLTQKYQTVKEAQDAGVISAQRLTNAILNFGAATGVSGANLNSIARIAGQIKSIGKLMGGDSMQLKNFGINVEEAIGQSIGKTTQQVIEMREKGLVTADMALNALVGSMEKFGKAAEMQGGSLGGLLASLDDLQKVAMRNIFGPMFESLKPALAGAVTALQSPEVTQAMKGFGESVGAGVTAAIGALQNLASQAQTLMSAFTAGLSSGGVGGGVSSLLTALGLDPSLASTVGSILNSIASAIQGGIGQVQTAIQSFQSGMAQGTPGAAVAGLLSALGIPDDLAGQIGAKVAEVNTAIQTAKGNIGTAIQSFVAGWQQGTPGAAVAGFLSAMGISEDVAAKVGSVVASIAQAVQNAKTTLQNVIQGFQSGGVAGGATALLQSLGLDTSIVGQAQTVLGNIASAIKDGVQRVKDAVASAMSGGGVSGVLSALGLDPAIASQAQTLFNTVVSAVQSGIGRIKDAISAAVGGQGAAGVLRALGLSDETVGQIKSVIDRIGAVVGVLAQNFQSGFQQAAQALGPIQGPLKELATLVGGLVVGAFLGLVGFVAGAMPGIANVIAGVVRTVNGTLQLLAEFVKGVISIIANLIHGDWAGAWQAAVTMVQNMNTRAQEIMNGLKQAAFGIFQALVGGIISAFDGLYAAVTGEQLPSLVATVQAKFEELRAAAVAKVQELVDGAKAVFVQLVQGAQQIISDVQATFASINWGEVGSNIVQGIANGIRNGAGAIADAAKSAAQHALDAAKGFLGIQSPSKVMAEEVGLPLAQGLAAGFAQGMDGSALVGIVASIRRVMEEIGKVLKGVGDAVSMSDWEDLAGPIGQMADMVKALADVGATLAKGDAARNWEAARGQVASLVASARAMMTDLASIVKGVGDVVSTSDWEDLVGPLKLLADGIAAVTSAVTNTAQAVKVMQEALTVNWVKLDVATLTAGLSQIASTGVQLLQAALDATASMKTLTEQGLAPLKLAADGVGAAASLVSSALDVTRSLFEFASNVILRTIAQSVGARAYFAALATDITKLGAAIVDGFTRAAISVGQPVVDATKRFADAVGNLNTGITSTIALVNTLVVLLRRGMPEVNADELATLFVGPLVRLGVTLSTAANSAAQSLTGLDTTGLDKLKNVIGGLLDTFQGIVDTIDYLLGGEMQTGLGRLSAVVQQTQRMFDALGMTGFTVTAEDVLRQLLDPILALGRALTQIVAQGTEALSGLDTSGYDKLASVMGNAQDTLKKIMDLSDFVLDMLENGGLFEAATRVQAILNELNTRLAGLGMGPTTVKELLRQMLAPILALGVALAEVAAEATVTLADLNTAGLSKLNEAVSGLQTALTDIPKLVKQIIDTLRRGYPTVDPQQVATNLFNPLFALAIALVQGANTAAAGIKDVATGAIEKLSSAIGTVLGAVKDTLDLLKLLNTTLANGPIALPDTLHEELVGFLTDYAALLAQAFLTSANAFEGQVEDAAKELQAAFNAALGVAKDALDTLKLFGEALTNGPIALPDTLHAELMGFLTDYAALLADAFLSSANMFTGQVEDAAKELQAAISAAVSVAKSALDVLKLFGEALANGPIPLPDTLHAELMGFLTDYAALLADAFLASANAFTGKVGDGAKALQEAIGGAVSVAKNALDLLKLFGEALANGPIPMPDALHEELVGFLTDYASLLASAYLTSANAFTGKVGDGAKALQEAIGGAVSVAKNALDLLKLFGEALANGPIPLPDTLHAELVGFLTDYAALLADAYLVSANAFKGKVGDGAKALQDAIGGAVSVSKNALDMLKLLGDALAHGPIPLPDTLHAELVGFLTDYAALLSDAFLVSANAFRGKVTDAAKQLADAMGLTLNVVKGVLEFNELRAAIVSFKPLDMAVYGPKLDMIFLAVKQVAARFIEKAKSTNISKDMQDAADALSKVFGDAAGSIKGALDMAKQLLDPETQIPSIGQLDAKLTAILNLIEAVTLKFAAKAASIGPDTAKSAEGLSGAVKSVFDAISQVIAAVKDAADLNLGTAGFNNIEALLTYLFNTFDQFAGRSEGVNAVTAAITSLLGGIQALTADAGTAAGNSWAQQFASAITANAGMIQAAIGGAVGGQRALAPGAAGSTATVTNVTNNNQRYVTINSVINVASTQESERALGGIYSLVTMFG